MRSPLPVMYQFFLVLLVFSTGGEGSSRGEGEGGWGEGWREGGGGGQGTFHPPCHIYCTTTWCFALKGLRTTSKIFQSICVPLSRDTFSTFRGRGLDLDPESGPGTPVVCEVPQQNKPLLSPGDLLNEFLGKPFPAWLVSHPSPPPLRVKPLPWVTQAILYWSYFVGIAFLVVYSGVTCEAMFFHNGNKRPS